MQQKIELNTLEENFWQPIKRALHKDRLAQAFLFISSSKSLLLRLTYKLITSKLCQETSAPCTTCKNCRLVFNHTHPTVNYIKPEDDTIKIDQIRALQQQVYQTTTNDLHRFIVLEKADKMNIAAANALLKILEEPPKQTTFILIAEQNNSLPITILSRCQQYYFEPSSNGNYLEIENHDIDMTVSFTDEAKEDKNNIEKADLLKNSESIIEELLNISAKTSSPCDIALKWKEYKLENVLWILHKIIAQTIRNSLLARTFYPIETTDTLTASSGNKILDKKIIQLSENIEVYWLFKLLDEINLVTKKLQLGINFNQTLVLESLLLKF